jgi:hypothetical protein
MRRHVRTSKTSLEISLKHARHAGVRRDRVDAQRHRVEQRPARLRTHELEPELVALELQRVVHDHGRVRILGDVAARLVEELARERHVTVIDEVHVAERRHVRLATRAAGREHRGNHAPGSRRGAPRAATFIGQPARAVAHRRPGPGVWTNTAVTRKRTAHRRPSVHAVRDRRRKPDEAPFFGEFLAVALHERAVALVGRPQLDQLALHLHRAVVHRTREAHRDLSVVAQVRLRGLARRLRQEHGRLVTANFDAHADAARGVRHVVGVARPREHRDARLQETRQFLGDRRHGRRRRSVARPARRLNRAGHEWKLQTSVSARSPAAAARARDSSTAGIDCRYAHIARQVRVGQRADHLPRHRRQQLASAPAVAAAADRRDELLLGPLHRGRSPRSGVRFGVAHPHGPDHAVSVSARRPTFHGPSGSVGAAGMTCPCGMAGQHARHVGRRTVRGRARAACGSRCTSSR